MLKVRGTKNQNNMGIPLPCFHDNIDSSCKSSFQETGSGNPTDDFPSCEKPSYLFVYGNLRPDAPSSQHLLATVPNQRAWLLGSRLYSTTIEGVERAAVKLEERGYAVLGYAVSLDNVTDSPSILRECERREYSPEFYSRDVVEVS
eukprot:TRINITY_DN8457_c0_g1_i7.p1 TRINITY_DN8457_c0_g1~~TRINITY_DN8457_c0_g1_i7.p1  ORF type:complete len:146 (+),score=26.10 TRINITY_DN8457_c0_g1_i7:290-727(+)